MKYDQERKSMKRFETIYSQGTINVVEILLDRETGIQYVFRKTGNAGGMTPLLDKDGKPMVEQPKIT